MIHVKCETPTQGQGCNYMYAGQTCWNISEGGDKKLLSICDIKIYVIFDRFVLSNTNLTYITLGCWFMLSCKTTKHFEDTDLYCGRILLIF
jgi:hypothetical protein